MADLTHYTTTSVSPDASIVSEEGGNRYWRWWVLGTLFLATFLNYFDRQTLGTAIDPISEEFGLNNIQRGQLLSAFVFTYAFTHLFIGLIIDRIDNLRWFFPVMVLGWSASTILVGFAQRYETLLGLRYLLGVWEAVNFPICLLIIARIFPAKERSLASGIFASGAFLATLTAPYFVIYFSNEYNWRWSFILAGALGVVWLIPWLLIFRHPEKKSALWRASVQERAKATQDKNIASVRQSYLSVLKAPGFWGVALIGLGIIPSLYFATQWFPSFFTQALGHPYDQSLARNLSIIYFMQDVGLWAGGALVLWLSRKRFSILASRKMVMTGAYVLMLSIVFAPMIQSITASVVIFCVYVLGIGAFLANQHAFKQDVDPKQVATVAALVGFVETGFTAFVIKEIGMITEETADFTPVFWLLAGLATFSVVISYTLLRPQWLNIK